MDDTLACIISVAEDKGWEVLFYTPAGDDVEGITIGPKEYLDKVQRYFDGEEDWIRPIR
jgi:hypothetical protein